MGDHCSRSTESLAVPMWPQTDQIYGHETSSLKSRTKPYLLTKCWREVFASEEKKGEEFKQWRSLPTLLFARFYWYDQIKAFEFGGVWNFFANFKVLFILQPKICSGRILPTPGVEAVWNNSCFLNKQLHYMRNHTLNLAWRSALFLLSVHHSFGNHAPFK